MKDDRRISIQKTNNSEGVCMRPLSLCTVTLVMQLSKLELERTKF
jgi:hypothetical protein